MRSLNPCRICGEIPFLFSTVHKPFEKLFSVGSRNSAVNEMLECS